MEGGEEVVEGWVNAVKRVGGIVFLEVVTGLDLKPVTVVFKRSSREELWREARRVKLGSAVRIAGKVPEVVVSKRGREVHAERLEVLSEPLTPLPVDPTGRTGTLLDTRVNYRYLLLRSPGQRAVFKIRALVLRAAREYLEERGFLEVHTPKICGAGAEGGATVFELDYFGTRAYLSQSPQLYKQMLVAGVPRVYEIAPYFRAEKFSTTRHLNECWAIDVEMAFIKGMEDVLEVLEGLVLHVIDRVAREGAEELEALGVELKRPRTPFYRLRYSEALELLEERGIELEWGEDFGSEEERVLGEIMAERGYDAYFIVEYPWEAKPFYIMRRENGLSESFDLDYRGLELASGGQREHRYSALVENMELKGLDPRDFEFYLEAFRYGMPPHGGFGLGVERLVMQLLRLGNIREVALFPRDRFRLYP